MSDLSKLLFGSTLKFGTTAGITVGQVIDASGQFMARSTQEFRDVSNDAASQFTGRRSPGTLSVRAVAGKADGADVSQLLRGATLSWGATAIGQVIGVSGTLLTRDTPEFPDCANDLVAVLVGGCRYGALTVTFVPSPTATTGDFDKLIADAESATQTRTATLTFLDTMVLAGTQCRIVALDIPGAGGNEARVEASVTFQPITVAGTAGVWTLADGGILADLLAKAIDADPVDDVEFVYPGGAKITATAAVITSLEMPAAGDPDGRVEYSLSLRPVNGSKWAHTGTA